MRNHHHHHQRHHHPPQPTQQPAAAIDGQPSNRLQVLTHPATATAAATSMNVINNNAGNNCIAPPHSTANAQPLSLSTSMTSVTLAAPTTAGDKANICASAMSSSLSSCSPISASSPPLPTSATPSSASALPLSNARSPLSATAPDLDDPDHQLDIINKNNTNNNINLSNSSNLNMNNSGGGGINSSSSINNSSYSSNNNSNNNNNSCINNSNSSSFNSGNHNSSSINSCINSSNNNSAINSSGNNSCINSAINSGSNNTSGSSNINTGIGGNNLNINSNNSNNSINNSNSNNNNTNNLNDSRKSCNKLLLKDSPTFSELIQPPRHKRLSPTQESSNMSFSSASVAGSIQDDIGDPCGLTKAGLEEYTMRANSFYDNPVLYHHQKQSSYAQSEGYHSYVSSSDSTSATPMLDRLRQESDLLSRQTAHNWSQNDLSSLASNSVAASPTSLMARERDLSELSVVHQQQQQQQLHNNSSESTSSTETLKWLGSMSDVSEVSHATGFSAISESVSTSQLIVHSSRVLTPKRHQSESVLFPSEELPQLSRSLLSTATANSAQPPQHSPGSQHAHGSPTSVLTPSHRHSPSYPPVHQTSHSLYRHHHHSQLNAGSPEGTVSEKSSSQSNISVTISNSEAVVTISPHPPPVVTNKPPPATTPPNGNGTDINKAEPSSPAISPGRLASASSSLGKPVSASMDSLADIKTSPAHPYRNNHRLFPVSTYTEPVHSNTSHFVHHPKPQYSTGLQKPQKAVSLQQQHSPTGSGGSLTNLSSQSKNYPQPSWQSVAALINDFERSSDQQQQQPTQQKYTYLDPNKTHRVPNPALKAFQKNAVQSYFERQQQQQQQQQQLPATQQPPSPEGFAHTTTLRTSGSPQHGEGVQTVLLRNSLPSNYNSPPIQRPLSEDKNAFSARNLQGLAQKPPSPAPPPPPPRSRSMMPSILRRSSSASDYGELRDQFVTASQEKLHSQSIKNISNSEKFSFNDCGMPPPPPPPRGRPSMSTRRTSSASDYAGRRDKVLLQQAAALTHQQLHPHQHPSPHSLGLMSHSYHGHLSHSSHPHHHHQHQHHHHANAYLAAPLTAPLHEGWVPERPPKNPNLRVPSPELPPPPPGPDTETALSDEPLPPPPPEILQRQPLPDEVPAKPPSPNRRNSFAGASTRKANFFGSRTTSNESGINKGPPPIVPRKPVMPEMLQVSRPAPVALPKMQPELLRATAISSSTRKRPHNLAASSSSSVITAIQENVAPLSPQRRQSPSGNAMKASPPPPPLMPRMQQNTIATTTAGPASPSSHAATTTKSRCNSKASYLPRQSLDKQSSSDPDHGSYKLTLHEDLVTSNKTHYDILSTNTKLPTNLPDVLPLGAKLQPPHSNSNSNINNNANPVSLRYGSNNNLSSNQTPVTQQAPASNCYPVYPPTQQQQQRYSTPILNTFTLSGNAFSRSQSYDTNANHHSPTSYMSQSSLDLKKSMGALETTIEEQLEHQTAGHLQDAQNSSLSSLSSLSESCASHEEMRLNGSSSSASSLMSTNLSSNSLNSNSNVANDNSSPCLFRAELVNTTFANGSKKSVTRQESLRENIEKITQLQSQLMSAHITEPGFLGGYTSSLSPHSNAAKTAQANVIDIPKTLEREEEDALSSHNSLEETLPSSPLVPPASLEESDVCRNDSYDNSTAAKANESSDILAQLDTSTDSLKMVQRSELILRVNPSTVETASQTDDITDSELKSLTEQSGTKDTETSNRTSLQPRQRLPIEDDCDKMSKELAQLLPANDALVQLLCPPGNKSVQDYISNLYNPNVPQRPAKRDVGTSTLTRSHRHKGEDQESNEKMTVELKLTEIEITADNCDTLKTKVDDLIKQLTQKVKILAKEQSAIDEESAVNDELGNGLLNKLCDKVRPIEESKCRTYIADIGHITGLLLSLSERLARAENQLTAVADNEAEKKSLENKRDRLYEQLTEAKRLKADIDRRGSSVTMLLEKNLNAEEFADFEYFINMKAKLITDSRDIADKIKAGEEIIAALSDTLIQSDC